MKKVIFCAVVVLSTIAACKKDNLTADSCGSTTRSYATDVAPIIASSCATNAGCHATGSSRKAYTSYSSVSGDKDNIYSQVKSGSMPKGSTLTAAQKTAILCWIDQGAANN